MPFIVKPGKNRKFNHVPIYYDKEKEEFEERVNKTKDNLDKKDRGEFVPNIRGKFEKPRSGFSIWQNPKGEKSYKGRSFFFLINIVLVIAIVYLCFKFIPFFTSL